MEDASCAEDFDVNLNVSSMFYIQAVSFRCKTNIQGVDITHNVWRGH